jgi:hypothetical protein
MNKKQGGQKSYSSPIPVQREEKYGGWPQEVPPTPSISDL